MGCCGQNRASFAARREPQPASLPTVPVAAGATSLRFLQSKSIVVRGPLTGRSYEFHRGAYTGGIDASDAAALLKSGYFERAAG